MVKEKLLWASIGTEQDEQIRLNADVETKLYLEKGELPDHFILAGKWLLEQVRTEGEFYQQYQGKYIAVINIEPLVMEVASERRRVIKRAIERWGIRPIHSLKMDPSVLRLHFVGPGPRIIRE